MSDVGQSETPCCRIRRSPRQQRGGADHPRRVRRSDEDGQEQIYYATGQSREQLLKHALPAERLRCPADLRTRSTRDGWIGARVRR